jgi:hypothetical protein
MKETPKGNHESVRPIGLLHTLRQKSSSEDILATCNDFPLKF